MFRGYRRSRHLPRFLNAEQDPGEFSFGLTLGQGVVGATDVGARRAELLIPTRRRHGAAFDGFLVAKTDAGLRKRLPFLDTLVASAIAARVFNRCSLLEWKTMQNRRDISKICPAAQQLTTVGRL